MKATQEQLRDDNWGIWDAPGCWFAGTVPDFGGPLPVKQADGTMTGSLTQAREYFRKYNSANNWRIASGASVRHYPDGAEPDLFIYHDVTVEVNGVKMDGAFVDPNIKQTWTARVGPYDYEVFVVTLDGLKAAMTKAKMTHAEMDEGFCDTDSREIWILHQDVQRMQDSYLHECIHAAEDVMGDHFNETQVRFLASILGSAMRDAPELE